MLGKFGFLPREHRAGSKWRVSIVTFDSRRISVSLVRACPSTTDRASINSIFLPAVLAARSTNERDRESSTDRSATYSSRTNFPSYLVVLPARQVVIEARTHARIRTRSNDFAPSSLVRRSLQQRNQVKVVCYDERDLFFHRWNAATVVLSVQ